MDKIEQVATDILEAIRANIRRIIHGLNAARKDEKQQLQRELRLVRKQEREAKKYV